MEEIVNNTSVSKKEKKNFITEIFSWRVFIFTKMKKGRRDD